ncbi:hypothetical protein WN944_012806 [Citrus x changshan-huyou]|uniref:Secreted protein n=1 Tax=Citrus x changshan-huyou TaxID=2935761 RepID=A0AAP0M5E3_9ROSI
MSTGIPIKLVILGVKFCVLLTWNALAHAVHVNEGANHVTSSKQKRQHCCGTRFVSRTNCVAAVDAVLSSTTKDVPHLTASIRRQSLPN